MSLLVVVVVTVVDVDMIAVVLVVAMVHTFLEYGKMVKSSEEDLH